MLSKIKNELLFAGVIQNSNEKVRQDILEDNRKAAIFWATIQLIFWSFSVIMSRINPEYTDCLPVYIIVLVICGIALFLALYVCPKHLNRMQKEREEVQVEPGECCTRPYECWYYAYCHTEPTRTVALE